MELTAKGRSRSDRDLGKAADGGSHGDGGLGGTGDSEGFPLSLMGVQVVAEVHRGSLGNEERVPDEVIRLRRVGSEMIVEAEGEVKGMGLRCGSEGERGVAAGREGGGKGHCDLKGQRTF